MEEREQGTGNGERAAEARDWVQDAYDAFIKDAKDIDPTDPVKAVEVYFKKNATDELKARCKAEGKDAKGCWKFIEAVARKALRGSSGHIDPGVIYANAMHWFEDVPKDWDKAVTKAERSSAIRTGKSAEEEAGLGNSTTPSEIRKEKAKAKAAKKRKAKDRQGFFFEMLETPPVGGCGDESPRTEQEGEVKG